MANISKRGNSYRIRVSCGFDGKGRRQFKVMSWTPPTGMTEKQIEKELQRVTVLFEEQVRNGTVLDLNTRFREFAERWFRDYANKQLKARTIARYTDQMCRINDFFGNMKMNAIRPCHLNEFYNTLGEKGARKDTKYKPNEKAAELIKNSPLTMEQLAQEMGGALSIVRSCKKGKNVTLKSAERFANYFGKKVKDLFDQETSQSLSEKTIRNYHLLLSSIFTTAVQWQVIFSNPCERVKPPKVHHKEERYLDEKEAAELIRQLDGEPYQYAVMVQVLLYTGLRRGELLGLEWTDIDFENKFLSVRRNSQYVPSKGVYDEDPKTEHSRRRIRISDNVVELLKAYKEWQDNNIENLGDKWEDTNRLFTKWNGGAMHPDTISGWFHNFIKRKQLPDVCIHSLRHTNATLMVANGIPIKVVSDRLGHASVTTTSNFYLHMIQSADDAAANMLNDLLAGNQ